MFLSLFPSNELLGAESDSDDDEEMGCQLLRCSFFLFGVSRDVISQITNHKLNSCKNF